MKETHYKLKHRVTALFAAAVMLCSMLPGAAFAEEPTPQPTEETVQMEQQTEPSETDNGQADESSPDPGEDVTEATPETAEEQPAEEEISAAVVGAELYTDLPDAPIGSYIGSEGLPVATGSTKIGISEWPESQLEEGGSYLTAVALDNDGLAMAAPLLDGADYAIVPIMAQVEYPADGSSTDMILPDGVTLLDFYGEPAADTDTLLHNSYHETSAAVMGVYVQAAADFTAQLVYTGPDGSTQTKTLYVTIDREHMVASPFADAGIAAYAERPTPSVTSGKITKVQKVNGTWLIWFNGDEAYCCTPGADGQPKNCPLYTYVDTSMVGADQYVPGDHYGNQFRIWGGLTQLSLGMQEFPPVALSAEAPSLLDSCRTVYTDTQMQIIENYPDSTAAKILMGSAQALFEGTDAYASARGYYTYIYQPGRAGWQTVAVIGPEISDDEPNPKPIVQEIYANWEAPAQTASGSFDFDYGIITDKVQFKTTEKVDGATIEIEPITKSGTIDGGTWNISPADKQTVTTAGHTNDDNYQNNGGAASASWTLHYSVSKTTDSRSGRVGPYTTQDEADAAADSARDAAIAELQGEAQRMVDNAVASAKAELANIKFRYEEVGVPYGFEMYWGGNGSKQTISVPANSNNAYLMKNDEWSLKVNIKKGDSETGNQIAADAQYEIFQWDTVTGKYQPTGGYNTYSVQRQGNGTYDGKRKTKWQSTGLPTKGNKRRAEAMMRELQDDFEPPIDPNGPPSKAMLFADFLVQWLEIAKSTVKLTTYSSYKGLSESQIIPYFRSLGVTLGDLKAVHIQSFYQKQLERVKPNTVIHYHAIIHRALKYAVKTDLIDVNPADKVDRPKKNEFTGNFYSREEMNALFDAVRGNKIEIPVMLAAFYGLRRSEVVGLKWDAVDFEQNTLEIRHTVATVRLDGKKVIVESDTTKTKASKRTLPLVPVFQERLLALQEEQKENRKLCGRSYNKKYDGYICVDPMGNLLLPNALSDSFQLVLRDYNLRRIRFHDLRHSCASLLLANNVPMKQIQEWLGHSDFSTTANIYSHLDYSSKVSSAEAMLNGLGMGSNPQNGA